MKPTFDRHLFTQIGLDSGSLTMLGTIVHSFGEPGEYRCVVHEGERVRGTFVVSSDKSSPNAQVHVDLASVVGGRDPAHADDCGCCNENAGGAQATPRFVVNPRGYVVFHISRGGGGYYVHARRTDAPQEDKGFDSRSMTEGDLFSAIVLRPGTYSVVNGLSAAKGELVVAYPVRGETKYPPPPPVRVVTGPRGFEPARVQVAAGQGIIFENRTRARIQVKLEKPDDGPRKQAGRPIGGHIPNQPR